MLIFNYARWIVHATFALRFRTVFLLVLFPAPLGFSRLLRARLARSACIKAELRGEAFNSLNQVVFGAPNTVLTSGQFGVISSQSNTPRDIQVALKLIF